ncbi:MAG: chromosome segregation protein SMC [Pseudomonadales bacterium]|nr:chromosome segregation protein SMC [Pseudomonadales bacterium]
MRLKHVKLAGFKSFVDPTTATFPSNLTAVVGPNGCGKSNIIDAVRWVMGESSARNLRGEAMTDVIFNGSNNRKPAGQASVELIFDNSDHKLVGEYAAYNEISIRRVVTRDGQSQYFLNGTKCRRRDITDIFLGTGLGPRSYSIIEQGMISRLIEAKPEELRVFIEEAAGISKYKERRRDTESRMKRTRENLERLTDIREELERQLSHLQRQAAAAEKYGVYKEEERLLKAQLAVLRWKKLDGEVSQRSQLIRELEIQVEALVTEQVAIDTRIEKLRADFTEQTDRLNAVQARFYASGSEVERIEQTIRFNQERAHNLRNDLAQTDSSISESTLLLTQDEEKIALWRSELEELSPELEMGRESELELTELLSQAEQAMQQWQQEWDEFNQAAHAPRQEVEVQQSRLLHFEKSLARMNERIERLEQEKRNLIQGPEEQEILQLREQLAELDALAEERQAQLDELLALISALRDSNVQRVQSLDEARLQMQTLAGRQASLQALQQAALGNTNEGINDWLVAQQLDNRPRVADGLRVNAGWETAVETVLGSYLQAVCVDSIDALAQQLTNIQQGSLMLLAPNTTTVSAGASSWLQQQVSGVDAVNTLLAGVHCAETLEAALAMRSQLAAGESVVTREGIWLGSNWLRVARDTDVNSGVLARKAELEVLTEELAQWQQRVEQLDGELQASRAGLAEKEAQLELTRRELGDLTRKHGETRAQLSAREARVEQMLTRRDALAQEISEIHEQLSVEKESQAEARAILETAIESMERDTQQRENLLNVRDKNRQALDDARQKTQHQRNRAHELAMREQSLRAQLDAMSVSVARLQQQVAALQERRIQLRESLEHNDDPNEELKLQLEEKLQQRLLIEDELKDVRIVRDEVEHDLRQAEQGRSHADRNTQAARSRLEQERIAAQEAQVRRKALDEQLDETQFDRSQLMQELPEDISEERWVADLEQLSVRIARLGPLNLAAIDEYKSQSERKTYLDAQNDDLQEALQTLENAIRKIDRETRTRFKETFDSINSGFQELFPRVFGGGHAYLEMTGEDLLDTGVSIMARPPGKRNSTIHLLSGGEKAMTAIALVFSIFRLNPAPFCILDEVDAPLDDANVGRYSKMVAEMSEKVQFIFITHNKGTMEVAHQLMGVTMHEPGASRLVSVDVNEAVELAAV